MLILTCQSHNHIVTLQGSTINRLFYLYKQQITTKSNHPPKVTKARPLTLILSLLFLFFNIILPGFVLGRKTKAKQTLLTCLRCSTWKMETGRVAVLHLNYFFLFVQIPFWSLSKHMHAVCTENTVLSKSESLSDYLLLPALLLTGILPGGDILCIKTRQ